MDRRQFCILISIINVCLGSAVHYLDNGALNDGSGGVNILLAQIAKANIFIALRRGWAMLLALFQVAQSTLMEICLRFSR